MDSVHGMARAHWLGGWLAASDANTTLLAKITKLALTHKNMRWILVLAGLAFVFLILVTKVGRQGKHYILPPGPRPLPIMGNVHQIPQSHPWLRYYEWSKTYGPILYLNMLGQPLVILNDVASAHELLNRRGAQYAGRPLLFLGFVLATGSMNQLLMPYTERYRQHMRAQTPLLSIRAAALYQPLMELESRQMLFNLLSGGDNAGPWGIDVMAEMERSVASIMRMLAFSRRVLDPDEPEAMAARALHRNFSTLSKPGASIVDVFPWLDHLPLPELVFKPWRKRGADHYHKAHDTHLRHFAHGKAAKSWNWAKTMARLGELVGMTEIEIAFDVGGLYEAALDTSAITMTWFLVAWASSSFSILEEEQKKKKKEKRKKEKKKKEKEPDSTWVTRAQAQLDAVVGSQSFPEFMHRAELPYIEAIAEEALRWRPTVPGGAPHMTSQDDSYKGMRIPAGSIVLANHWAIARDPTVYGNDVDDFRPERWLEVTDGVDPSAPTSEHHSFKRLRFRKELHQVGFGYGRRACSGRHMARHGLFIQIARLLWAFDLSPAGGENGENIIIAPDHPATGDSMLSKPLTFRIVLRPRSVRVRKLIEANGDTSGMDIASLLDEIGKAFPTKSISGDI